jgi:hypothetical protein
MLVSTLSNQPFVRARLILPLWQAAWLPPGLVMELPRGGYIVSEASRPHRRAAWSGEGTGGAA